MADESPKINPDDPGLAPDPWHDTPATTPETTEGAGTEGAGTEAAAADEAATTGTAAVTPEAQKIPDPWHD